MSRRCHRKSPYMELLDSLSVDQVLLLDQVEQDIRADERGLHPRVRVYPYGPDIQRHFEELVKAGVSESDARDQSSFIEVDWPDAWRLPVPGDSLSVEWAHGRVAYARFSLEDGEWSVSLKLAPR